MLWGLLLWRRVVHLSRISKVLLSLTQEFLLRLLVLWICSRSIVIGWLVSRALFILVHEPRISFREIWLSRTMLVRARTSRIRWSYLVILSLIILLFHICINIFLIILRSAVRLLIYKLILLTTQNRWCAILRDTICGHISNSLTKTTQIV